MSYTERFSEVHDLLACINPASYQSEQNTGYVSLKNYHRLAIVCHAGVLGQDVDFDIEAAQDTSGTGAGSFDSGSKNFTWTATTDDNARTIIEIRPEELDIDGNDCCINVEATPAGASAIFCVQVWGIEPRFAPVPTTLLDAVVD